METQLSRSPTGSIVRIEPSRGWFTLRLHEVWSHRELLYFLTWRDLKLRYKQTALGALWAVVQPLMLMVVFTFVFGNFAKVPSDGLPYPIFAYVALVPWNFFAGALSRCVASFVGNSNIISKVYFPRLIVPLAAVISGFLDFAISFAILVAMMAWFGFTPGLAVLTVPLFLLLALMTALAAGLWLAALNVKYRDVSHGISFVIQLWMYASPVAYPIGVVPEDWRYLYMFNPMVTIIQGFRWALLGAEMPDVGISAVSIAAVIVLLFGGIVYFKRTERTMVDVI